MKIRNQRIYSTPEHLKRLAEELDFIGRDYKLDLKQGLLTVFALPRRRKDQKQKRGDSRRPRRS